MDDMSGLMDSMKRQEEERLLKEQLGEDYKPLYSAFSGGSVRCTRLEFITSEVHGEECGFIMQYIHLDPMEFTGGSVITLNYKHEVLVIQGRNLDKIVRFLREETLATVRVFSDILYRNESGEDDVFIESIQRIKPQKS